MVSFGKICHFFIVYFIYFKVLMDMFYQDDAPYIEDEGRLLAHFPNVL